MRERILEAALKLFAERGFDAVSTSMLASEVGITKGALYRHFRDKRAIFDALLERMTELDAQRAEESSVPADAYEADPKAYAGTTPEALLDFVPAQFDFWTTDSFAVGFRRMLTLEQFKSREMTRLYQQVLCNGPVSYSADIFRALCTAGRLTAEAEALGPDVLAMELFAPLQLCLQLWDGGEDRLLLRGRLVEIVNDMKTRWLQ